MFFYNMLAKSLVMILIEQFNKDMGLKSLEVLSVSFFRIIVMKDELMLCRLALPW